ncbi:MAG: Cof-type HAD-IIB family hydrolase [Erysipelotrichaceae bacterium]|nr:Cof-type HAD-IIB family hydrolase [Erysipelotrichaceae bacterium]
MYKIIACDLDETLLSTDRSVSQGNIEAIKKARELGVKFVLATGRGFKTVQGTLKELGLDNVKDEYVISFNGGAITENYNNRLLSFNGITFEFARELFNRGLDYDVCIHVYSKDVVYGYNMCDDEIAYLKGRMDFVEIKEDNIDFLKDEEIAKVLYMNKDINYLNKIEEELADITHEADVSYSSNRYIEFNRKGVNKGAGLRTLAKLLGVAIEDTMAIGDNLNDLAMIKDAGLGVGVANVVTKMKDDCEYITEADHNHDAIKEVIEKFILNVEDEA